MADLTMPKMGFDMEEGTVVRWIKKVGDDVKKGEAIAEIETDKVTIEIEAFASGTLQKIVAEEGTVVPVGGTIAVLGGADDAPASDASAAPAASAELEPSAPSSAAEHTGEGGEGGSSAAEATEATPQADGELPLQPGYGSDVSTEQETKGPPAQAPSGSEAPQLGQSGGHVKASPVAKRLARENQVDIAQVSGTGPSSRIVRRDVEAFLENAKAAPATQAPAAQPTAQPAPVAQPAPTAQPAPAAQPVPAQPATEQPGVRRVPHTRIRQTIARRLAQSKGPIPHYYVTTQIDMDALMDLRKQLNANGEVKITVNDLVIKAAALAIRKYPDLNASWTDDAVEFHDYINVGIAVATDRGLLAPAITDVDKKSLGTISSEIKELAGRTREGKATGEELQRGTFSVSNMGMWPVDSFIAVINPPQSMILAVGRVNEQPVVRNGQIVIGQVMKVTLSGDHRVSDGSVGAEYLQELKRLIENPMLIVL